MYAFIPRRRLEHTVMERARELARDELSRVGQTMSLEAQDVEISEAALNDRAREILARGGLSGAGARMFGQVWSWAGKYRRSDKNIGMTWTEVPVGVHQVAGDAQAWIASCMDHDEAAVLFGHRLVSVHPFPNGNGRHSRLASDALAQALGRPAFTWGRGADLGSSGDARSRYLTAIRSADQGDIAPLVRFARS